MKADRMAELVEARRAKERRCGKGVIDTRNKTLYVENIPYIFNLFKHFLKISGLYKKWHENALAVQIRHEHWQLAGLPEEFDGFRILQISDIHIDALPQLSRILPELMQKCEYDLCVFNGDFRFDIHCSKERIDELLAPVVKEANKAEFPALAVLGNHDYLEYTLDNVEKLGLKFLFNESIALYRQKSRIMITGLDDVHFYRTGRLFEQRSKIRDGGFKIFLIHSPEYFKEAALAGYDLYLCGHTHGGQLCLPGGIPLISNSRSPGSMMKGRWHWRKMPGFTTTGAGASGIPLRWNCPPEIVIHHLRKR